MPANSDQPSAVSDQPEDSIDPVVTEPKSAAVDAADELVLIDAEIKQLFQLQEASMKKLKSAAGVGTIVRSRNGSRVMLKDELPAGQLKAFKTTCFSRYSIVVTPASTRGKG